ncbi:MAG: HAD family phosphatase [Tissierellia bacterium]|nr:HAD family phosphatase [Tissierellia bacterium]
MKAIIFDMDGVIIDSEPLHFKIERELLEELGGKITEEEHNTFVGTTDYHMWSTFKKQFNIKLSVEEIINIKRKRFIENIHNINLVDNFWDFLMKVYNANYILGLASSNNRKTVDLIVEKFNLDKYFKIAMSGEDVKCGKPDPEIFLKTAEKLGVSPSHCVVIEDAENGVIAAKSAGMKCIGLKSSNSGEQDLSKADLVINNFNKLDLEMLK